jgi:LEA14-like dessication related protein
MFANKYLLSIALLISLLFSSCKDFQEINVSKIDGFKVKSLTQEGITGEVKVKIKNPNPIGFNVYRSSCDVYFGDLYLGKAKLKKRIRVGANSDTEHTFNLEGKFKDMSLLQLTSLLSGKSQSLVLKGNLKVGKFFYRKNFPIDRKEKIGLGK